MHQQAWEDHLEEFQRDQRELLSAKGADYSGDFDRLANFRGTPGISQEQALVVHIWKQYFAVCRWAQNPKEERTQTVRERLMDIANYCILGAALAEEPGVPGFIHCAREVVD